MFSFKEIENALGAIAQGSSKIAGPHMNTKLQRWRDCIKLFECGWVQDGFDHVPNSYDIITYWKKDGEDERKAILLTFMEQQMWVRELTRSKK